ncbi:MAG TPA: hypothetical protein VF648_00575 [Pyrinomonadaceae bacterium]|jgi:hypothetical protein
MQTNTDNLLKFKFFADDAIKTAAVGSDGMKRVILTASSNADDLVGDVMSDKALQRMKDAAPGTTMFLNHGSHSVPEDVFGTVEAADFVKRSAQLVSGKTADVVCLDYTVIVEETNPRAVKTWEIIDRGKTKLGASVIVAVTEKSKNQRTGGMQIDDLFYLTCDIVGMPCNRQSWAQYAKKALELFPADQPANNLPDNRTAQINTNEENLMSKEVAATGNPLTAFTQKLASVAGIDTENKTVSIEDVSEVAIKGLFAEALEKIKLSPWQLWDTITTVVWHLARLKEANQNAGIEDKFDYRAALDTAVTEFSAALRASFANRLGLDEETADAGTKTAGVDTTEAEDAEIAEYSVQIKTALEKAFEKWTKADEPEAKSLIAASGARIVEIAKEMGIPVAAVALTEASPQISDDVITKSAKYVEIETKLKAAETDRNAAVTDSEKWKALALASKSALEQFAQKPLQTDSEK